MEPLIIHTANILGILNDPFEFAGDYDPKINAIRQRVFDLVVSPEAWVKHLSKAEIKNFLWAKSKNEEELSTYRNELIRQAVDAERGYGPTLSQLVTPVCVENIEKKQKALEQFGFSRSDLFDILYFIERYKDQKVFHFLRNNPSALLSLDKAVRDQAARNGKRFDLPILGSTKLLEGTTPDELKLNFLEAVFTPENLNLTQSKDSILQSLKKLDDAYLKKFFGLSANSEDLSRLSTPAGQVFFYWMYQSLNLHLISEEPQMIAQVNQAKTIFARTLGDSASRANLFKQRLIESNCGLLFTQESDAFVPTVLMENDLFLSVGRQNMKDGTLVILRSDLWESNYDIVSIDGYEGFHTGKLNVILATRKNSNQRFLLASCHGNSTRPEDGRLQISLIMEKFRELQSSDKNLQLFIGIDANTKKEEDVKLFKKHLDQLGLISTQVGPTTIKKRMVTAQHSKSCHPAIDEEDYLITLKPEIGGDFHFSHVTVGFNQGKVDTYCPLPNMRNPSDHYAVGALMAPITNASFG